MGSANEKSAGSPTRKTVHLRAGALSDLKQIKKELQTRALEAAEAALQRTRDAKLRAAQANFFQNAIGKVQPLIQPKRANLRRATPPPLPLQHLLDEEAAVRESMSDEMDITSLLDTDADLSYRRTGVGPDVPQKLRRGVWSIQRQVDLHGLRSDAARDALGRFIRECHRHGIRCVRVVHGKGLGSVGKAPVLKDKVRRWLVQRAEVLAFVQAPPMQGGKGALLVLLQPHSPG